MSATRRYLLTQPCYYAGRYLEAGEVLEVSADVKPSKTWTPVEDIPAEESEAPAKAPKSGKRDVSPI